MTMSAVKEDSQALYVLVLLSFLRLEVAPTTLGDLFERKSGLRLRCWYFEQTSWVAVVKHIDGQYNHRTI